MTQVDPPAASVSGTDVRPAHIVIVAATQVRLSRLTSLLDGAPFEVRGVARSVDDAVAMVIETAPAAVLIDLSAASGGLDLIEKIMGRAATPIVVTGASALSATEALALGAVDVVGEQAEAQGQSHYRAELLSHLMLASRIRVITHPRGRLRDRAHANGHTARIEPMNPISPRDAAGLVAAPSRFRRPPVVAIGASTGGPAALVTVLRGLPAEFPAPVVVVQHMADGFIDGLARWLNELVPLEVVVAQDGDRLRPGVVMLASSEGNLAIESSLRVKIRSRRPGQFHVPEVDTTFRCVADVCREKAVGVLLTGMGRDGADGLRRMRIAGAHTICQDESTSAVWGMPGAAAAMDAVDEELPVDVIADAVIDAVTRQWAQSGVTQAQAGGAA